MKKLLTLLFTSVLVFSLAVPVFAQDQPQGDTQQQETKAEKKASKKMKHAKKEKKAKKSKKEEKTEQKAGETQ